MTIRSNASVYYLSFSGNRINYIEKMAFQSYSKINFLVLIYNYFNLNFTKIYFDKYFECEMLDLTNNHIISVRNMFCHAVLEESYELIYQITISQKSDILIITNIRLL